MKARSPRWYENNKERLTSSRKNNRERLNDYWRSYYAKNKERINQRVLEQRQRNRGQNIMRFRVWDQAFEKLETNLVPSKHAVTLCEISTFVGSLTFWGHVCFVATRAIVIFLSFTTKLYHCVHLRYHRTVLRFVL